MACPTLIWSYVRTRQQSGVVLGHRQASLCPAAAWPCLCVPRVCWVSRAHALWSVLGVCTLMWAQTASAKGCTLGCAVTPVAPVSLCILGSVCCVTAPGQTFQLSNGGFCPCPSHVDVSGGVHTLPAMHVCNPCAMHAPGPAQLLPGPAQAFWGGLTCVAMMRVFATVASP